jgi:electron transfer flavoprotein alpha subunit
MILVDRIDGVKKIFTASSPEYAHGLAEGKSSHFPHPQPSPSTPVRYLTPPKPFLPTTLVITPVLAKLLDPSTTTTHLFSAHTAVNKDLFPRLSGSLNVSMIADIISLSHTEGPEEETTFKRPIYAGNAILEMKTSKGKDRVRVVTVRTTAFDKAVLGEDNGAEVVKIDAVNESSERALLHYCTNPSNPSSY